MTGWINNGSIFGLFRTKYAEYQHPIFVNFYLKWNVYSMFRKSPCYGYTVESLSAKSMSKWLIMVMNETSWMNQKAYISNRPFDLSYKWAFLKFDVNSDIIAKWPNSIWLFSHQQSMQLQQKPNNWPILWWNCKPKTTVVSPAFGTIWMKNNIQLKEYTTELKRDSVENFTDKETSTQKNVASTQKPRERESGMKKTWRREKSIEKTKCLR